MHTSQRLHWCHSPSKKCKTGCAWQPTVENRATGSRYPCSNSTNVTKLMRSSALIHLAAWTHVTESKLQWVSMQRTDMQTHSTRCMGAVHRKSRRRNSNAALTSHDNIQGLSDNQDVQNMTNTACVACTSRSHHHPPTPPRQNRNDLNFNYSLVQTCSVALQARITYG